MIDILSIQGSGCKDLNINNPDSIPPLDQRWLLVTLSAHFANGGVPATTQVRYLYILPMLGKHWANGRFLYKMEASNNMEFCETL